MAEASALSRDLCLFGHFLFPTVQCGSAQEDLGTLLGDNAGRTC